MLKLKEIKKMHPFMFVGLENNEQNPVISSIVNAVVKSTGIEFSKIQSPTRKRQILYARHLFCYFTRKLTKLSLQEVGDIVNRKHETVMHAVKTVENLLSYDKQFIKIVPEIEQLIEQYERVETN